MSNNGQRQYTAQDAIDWADSIECVMCLYNNGQMAAQGSTLAQEYQNEGLTVVYVAHPTAPDYRRLSLSPVTDRTYYNLTQHTRGAE